jgi:hypothetical protein
MPSARAEVRVSRVHLPFARVGMCLDCEACFEIGAGCPACGSRTWMPLAGFLERTRRRHGHVAEVRTHRNGNGTSSDRALQLLIVARDREALYHHFKNAFAGNPTISVVLDRRHGERRGGASGLGIERRSGDRRWKVVNDQLRVMGWVVVRAGVEAPVASTR